MKVFQNFNEVTNKKIVRITNVDLLLRINQCCVFLTLTEHLVFHNMFIVNQCKGTELLFPSMLNM